MYIEVEALRPKRVYARGQREGEERRKLIMQSGGKSEAVDEARRTRECKL